MSEQYSPARIAAEQLAVKREVHKPRSLSHKRWAAIHSPLKGWHVALIDCVAREDRHPGWTEAGHAWLDTGAPLGAALASMNTVSSKEVKSDG